MCTCALCTRWTCTDPCTSLREKKNAELWLFTFCLDLAVLNAQAIQCVLDNSKISKNRQAKQSIVIFLVAKLLQQCRKNSPNKQIKNMPCPNDDNDNTSDDENAPEDHIEI